MEQRALNCCERVLLVCEYKRWQRVSVALPALSPGVDACRRILNRRQCAIGLSDFGPGTGPTRGGSVLVVTALGVLSP